MLIRATAALLFIVAAFAAAPASAQDVKAGELKAAMCIGCHGIKGYQASFPEVHRVPRISGQNAKYIVAALNGYKKGDRRHPTMRAIAASLSDQDMADLAAFYEQHGRSSVTAVASRTVPPAPPEVQKLLEKGACISCHGADYNKAIDPSYPKLAGQYDDYLYVALRAYRNTPNPNLGRANAIMGAQVKPFTDRELRAMARYIGSLPTELVTQPQPRFR
jgi:cytochrome c553